MQDATNDSRDGIIIPPPMSYELFQNKRSKLGSTPLVMKQIMLNIASGIEELRVPPTVKRGATNLEYQCYAKL